jgi:hypothetical protein
MANFLSNIIAYFKTIPDLRVQGRSTYKLHQILLSLIDCHHSCCKGCKEIHNFAVNYILVFQAFDARLGEYPLS